MEQLKIINLITNKLQKERAVRALFLKGSFARQDMDLCHCS